MVTDDIDPTGIQSLLFTGWERLPHLGLVPFRFRGGDPLRGVRALLPSLAFGLPTSAEPRTTAVQLLLSARGLRTLGASPAAIQGLGREFAAGMTAEPSRLRLGDSADSVASWSWSDSSVDGLLLVYGETEEDTARLATTLAETSGLDADMVEPLRLPEHQREHFGFRDGLTNVRLRAGGSRRAEIVADGELLMGRAGVHGEVSGRGVLAQDGTLVAIRRLTQDVAGFWSPFREAARGDDTQAIALAAKAVGRWPNGMPLEPGQEREPSTEGQALSTLSFVDDPRGVGCPLGAHIRRSNPRSSLTENPELSSKIVAQHRLLRRGRIYGPPPPASAYPRGLDEIMRGQDASGDEAERGLLFVALCSDVRRQFEFVHQSWSAHPKFLDLRDETDPVISGPRTRFSIPTETFRRVLDGLGGAVGVRAGGYFLLPREGAIRRLVDGTPT